VTRSASRLAKLSPGSLDPAQRAVYDAVAGGRRAQGRQAFRLVDDDGGLEGPFNAFLLQPRLGHALQAVGERVRYETSLSDRAREIAILLVAVHWDSDFEWYAHAAVARSSGLEDAQLNSLRERDFSPYDGVELVVAQTVQALVSEGDLDDEQYAAVLEAVGEPGLFELLTLVGYYATLALQLRVFRVSLPGS
jgi:4-carboxymuconolactone decarboxylase